MTVTTIPLTGQAFFAVGTVTGGTPAAGEKVTIKPSRAILASDGTVLVPAQAVEVTLDDTGSIPAGMRIVPSDADATETVPYFVQELFGDFRSGYVSPLTADGTFNLFAADYDAYIPPDVPTELATQAALEQERSDRETADDTISDALAQAVEDLEVADSTNAAAVVTERNRAVSTEADLQAQITALPSTDDVATAVLAETTRAETVEAAKADLVGGKVPTSQLPAYPTFTSHSVASQSAMLALSVPVGDVAIRTDQGNARYLLNALPASTLGNWLLLVSDPTAGVDSVNGLHGPVVLGYADVGADQVGAAATAQSTAISTAAADATSKANAAQAAATAAAATDATSKANTAQTAATTAAATDATSKVAAEVTRANGAYEPILTPGLLTGLPATGTGSKAFYFATDAGLYCDLTNGGAYTKVADLPGQGGVQLARITVGTLVNITSTSVVALPSPGPAATGNVNIPAGTQAVKVRAEIPNVGATTAGTVVTLELFVDGVAVRGAVRNIVATGDVFDGSIEYQQNAPSAGNHTYEVRGAVSGNTGKLNTFPVGDSVVLTVTTVKTS